MVEAEAEPYPASRPRAESIQQFIKFCIIGLSSTIIDVGILNILVARVHMFWVIASTISFAFAVTNGFIWNSIWTFRGMGSSKLHHQYIKFVAVNIVGLALNLFIMNLIISALDAGAAAPPQHLLHVNVGKGVAVVFVSVWNFFANKKWTFS